MLRLLVSNTVRLTRTQLSRSTSRSLFHQRASYSTKPSETDPKQHETDQSNIYERIEETLNKLGFDRVVGSRQTMQ